MNTKACEEIKRLILEKLDMKKVDAPPDGSFTSISVNLCQEVSIGEDITINYTYTDTGRQLMILDIGVPVSISGIPWMTQYREEFGLQIEDMKSVKCNQPFVFGPSKRYVSKSLIRLPILII